MEIDYVWEIDYIEEYEKLIVKYYYSFEYENICRDILIPIDWLSNTDWYKEYEKTLMYEEEQKKLNERLKDEEYKKEYQLYLDLKKKFEE
jgi:hypothetical protein